MTTNIAALLYLEVLHAHSLENAGIAAFMYFKVLHTHPLSRMFRITMQGCHIPEDTTNNEMKSTEVQTSPMLASHAQLLPCGMYIHMLVALNATKYVIMTDVTTRLNLEESHQQYFFNNDVNLSPAVVPARSSM